MASYGLTSRQITILLIIAAAGILLRGVYLDRSYWFDELATLTHVDVADLPTVLRETAQDKQPPLYNSAAFVWVKAFGPGEIAVRSLSLVFGLLALATPWIARTSLNRGEKILSLVLLCVLSLPIKYAQEARNYSLLLLLSSACVFAYYEMLKSPNPRLRTGFYVALALLALSHLFGLLLAVSYAAVIFLRPRSRYERVGVALLAIALSAVVLVPLLLGGAAEAAGGNFWLKFTPQWLAWSLLLVFTPIGLVLSAYAVIRWRGAPSSIQFDALLAQALAPTALMFLGAVVLSLHTPLINDRNLIGMIPAFALLTSRLLQRAIVRDGAALAIALMFLLLVQSALMIYFGKLFIREDFRGIARQSIAANTRVCYVVPEGDAASWQSIMAFYVTRLFHRPDLEPRTFARPDLVGSASSAGCSLWAEAHPEGRASDLGSLSQFKRCAPLAIGTGRIASTSVLLSCPN
jgi:uncharacterized membrane protein